MCIMFSLLFATARPQFLLFVYISDLCKECDSCDGYGIYDKMFSFFLKARAYVFAIKQAKIECRNGTETYWYAVG